MPTTHGHEVETGCYCDGHGGWHGPAHVIALAQGYGFELDAEGQDAVDRYDSGDEFDNPDLPEIVIGQGGICDEAEAWLNDHTEPGYVWHWSDGEFFLSPMCEDPETCEDDECAHWD